MRRRIYPAVPLALIVPCVIFLLFGVFADLAPPPPIGELLPGTVVAAGPGRDAVLLSVDAADGPIICGIDRAALTDREVPPVGSRMTVDYSPEGCAPPPISEELPRWALFVIGGGGLALVAFWLWAGQKLGM